MKTYYVKWSSWFDTNEYPIDLIKSTIKEAGADDVWTENQFGWGSQPEVVVFKCEESEVENISNKIQEVLDTRWIIISEKDWKSKNKYIAENLIIKFNDFVKINEDLDNRSRYDKQANGEYLELYFNDELFGDFEGYNGVFVGTVYNYDRNKYPQLALLEETFNIRDEHKPEDLLDMLNSMLEEDGLEDLKIVGMDSFIEYINKNK